MSKLKTSVLGGALLAVASSVTYAGVGDPVATFDSTGIAALSPSVTFDYDEFGISPQGPQTVTQIDTDNNGVLSTGDAFTEMSLFFTNSFSLGGLGLLPQPGQGVDFQILNDIDLGGFVDFDLAGNLLVNFTSATGTQTIQDITPFGAVTPLANFSLGGASQCVITAASSLAQGSCKIMLNFAPVMAGLYTVDGAELFGNNTSKLEIDINVDNLAGLNPAYAGFGTTCGAGSGAGLCEQVLGLTHDGSAVHRVPEPGSLALLGLGLLGLAGARYKKTRS